jgi:Tfp pilus assembly protein PilN
MRAHFNLATMPLENNRRFIAGSSVLGIVGLAVLLLLSMHAVQVRRANQTTRMRISRLQSQIHTSMRQQEILRQEFKAPQAVEAMKRSQFLNGLIEQRTFPWTRLFADLGQILPPGVRVISISPKMGEDGKVELTFSVGAINDEQGNKFLRAISSSPVFSDVIPMQESRPQTQSNGDPDTVLLSLQARYSTL